ncbi:unnamed protein product [Brugia timori]|uniref:Transmembrane protein n=1 Tax=Brugia timori TaxID=42155 RepID=A0A0R3R039_9BILA|nr:unnamed protein product [Brugia timori]
MGNGLLVFGISILQVLSLCYPALLLSVTTLNVIAASVALFMVSYAISNTYFLAAVLFTVEGFHWVIIEVVLILTACASTACVICTFCSTFAIVRFDFQSSFDWKNFSYFSCTRHVVSPQVAHQPLYCAKTTTMTPPVRHMEEQSIYWSTDENPYYYQASKRYYDQPYRIDSGFYGYALVSPQMFDSPYAVMSADSSGRVGSGRYLRSVNSSAAQTRIGHIFS